MGATLRDLRRDVARNLGDLTLVTATVAGTTTTITDRVGLSGENYAGREVLFSEGTTANLGQVRYVASSDPPTRTLTLDPGLPAAVALGDRAEMVNKRGVGWRFDEYHDALNRALRSAGEAGGVAVVVDAGLLSRTTGTVGLPSGLAFINSVEWLDGDGIWHPIQRAAGPSGHGWSLRSGELSVVGAWTYSADGRALRIRGRGTPQPLGGDGDETTVDSEWLTAQAAVYLLRAGVARAGSPERERLLGLFEGESTRLRPKAIGRLGPNATKV